MSAQELERPQSFVARLEELRLSQALTDGFAGRKRKEGVRAWWQTVTLYTPEPWLLARGERNGLLPPKPCHRRAANR
jgi:hypothetical protein